MSSTPKHVNRVAKRRKKRGRRTPRRPTDYISVEEWNFLKNLCDDQSRGFLERFVTTMTRFEQENSLVLTRVCLRKRPMKKKPTQKKVKPKEAAKELPTVPFTACFGDDGCRMPCGALHPPLTWKPLRQALAVKYGFRPAEVVPASIWKSPQLLREQRSFEVLKGYKPQLGASRLGDGMRATEAAAANNDLSSPSTFGPQQRREATTSGGKHSMARVNFNTLDASDTLSPTRKARQAAAKENKKFSALIDHLSDHYAQINEAEAMRLYEAEMRRLYASAEPYMYRSYGEPYDLNQPRTWLEAFPAEAIDKYWRRFSY